MLTFYVIILIIIVVIWRYGIKKYKKAWKKRHTVIEELTRQREEIKLASDELRQPMARMTTIIGDMSMKEQTLEGREQLNSLHFQLLQIITRISEMQSTLENPEKKAESTAKDRLELNEEGEIELAVTTGQQLSLDIKPIRIEGQTQKFCVVFIDNNREFLHFMKAQLCEIYDFHVYDNIKDALPDIETLKADLIVCKHNMGDSITGSELCNQFKSSHNRSRTKFVLMTDTVLTQETMGDQNITLAADDYLAKPFNVQEAVMRFNKVMGLAPIEINQNVIEGKETRMLEGQNASMTTATMSFEDLSKMSISDKQEKQEAPTSQEEQEAPETVVAPEQPDMLAKYYNDKTIGDYSMSNIMDQQLMRNVEQFVLQNMSRGQISLEDMASAMGMGRVPFFHKIRAITTKTPAEIVREIRLKHACTLLINTNINLNELALNVGFMTAENFSNIFKEKYGMPPLEYRLKNKRS
jgi:AraC-like DNA-binding protein